MQKGLRLIGDVDEYLKLQFPGTTISHSCLFGFQDPVFRSTPGHIQENRDAYMKSNSLYFSECGNSIQKKLNLILGNKEKNSRKNLKPGFKFEIKMK